MYKRQPNKEVNTASLCRIGQEMVQEVVYKTNEMFKLLKDLQVLNTITLEHINISNSLWIIGARKH